MMVLAVPLIFAIIGQAQTAPSSVCDAAQHESKLAFAECLVHAEQYARAVTVLQALESPGDPSALYLLALAATRNHDLELGRRALDRLLAKEDTAEVRLMAASIEMETTDFDAAIANATRALESNASLPGAHYWKAAALYAAGDVTGAESETKAELSIAPGNPAAQLLLGRVFRRTGRTAEALSLLQQVIASHASEAAFVELAEAYLDAGQIADAQSAIATIRAHGGSSPEFQRLLARVSHSAGPLLQAMQPLIAQ